MSTAAIYIRKYFNKKTKDEATSLAKNIQREFIEMLKKVPWMDEDTRAKAVEKANKIILNVAYPDEMVDDHNLEEHYRELELQPHSLLQSVLRIRQLQDNKRIHRLREPTLRNDWHDVALRAADVDAFYHPVMNSISKFEHKKSFIRHFFQNKIYRVLFSPF